MGRSECQVTNSSEIVHVMQVFRDHNELSASCSDKVGEKLEMCGVLRFKGKFYIVVGNGGMRDRTTAYLRKHLKYKIYFPFNKPRGWAMCEDFIWRWNTSLPIESVQL